MSLENLAAQPGWRRCTLPATFLLTAFKAPLFRPWARILESTMKYTKHCRFIYEWIIINRYYLCIYLPNVCCWRSGWFSTLWWFRKCHLWTLTKHFLYLRQISQYLGSCYRQGKHQANIYVYIYLIQANIFTKWQDPDRSCIPVAPGRPHPITCCSSRSRYMKRFFSVIWNSYILTLNVHGKDGCWSWHSNILTTRCRDLTHWRRLWSWERLQAKGAWAEDKMAG